MDVEFLVQIRESDKCGSARNDEIFNLHVESGVSSWVSIHPAWHPIHLINQKKAKDPDLRFNSQQIKL